MEDFELKIGDLVKLRDDLEDGKYYGIYYSDDMKFNGFKIITKIYTNGVIKISKDDENYCYYTKEMIAEVKRLTKYATIYKRKEPILDDKEKEYLGNVIRPFRGEVIYIEKRDALGGEYINIELRTTFIYLPPFKENTMYKNMKLNNLYTLKELGL